MAKASPKPGAPVLGCMRLSPIRAWAGVSWRALPRRAGPEGGPGYRKAVFPGAKEMENRRTKGRILILTYVRS